MRLHPLIILFIIECRMPKKERKEEKTSIEMLEIFDIEKLVMKLAIKKDGNHTDILTSLGYQSQSICLLYKIG